MIVNHELKFIFFHVPKTAGTSFRLALSRIPGSVNIGQPTKHLTPAELGTVLAPDKVMATAGYLSFCFVRDPWERFGSLHRFLFLKHRDRYKVPEDLNDFVKALGSRGGRLQPWHSTRPQMDFAKGLSFVGKFESIEQDVAHIAQLIGWPHLTMKHKNASGDSVRYRDRMTAESQAIIAEIYRDDIERLGYR
jgi:hypothetical protein